MLKAMQRINKNSQHQRRIWGVRVLRCGRGLVARSFGSKPFQRGRQSRHPANVLRCGM